MTADKPLIYVVMPTIPDRSAYLPRALACWKAQDYPKDRFRLLVLNGGQGIPDDFDPTDPEIDYAFVPDKITLGEKFNRGIARAPEGSMVLTAGDDDWVSPRLLSTLAGFIQDGIEVVGGVSMFAFRERDQTTFLYDAPYAIECEPCEDDPKLTKITASYPVTISALTLFPKARWERCKFPDQAKASDMGFIRNLLANQTPMGEDVLVDALAYQERAALFRTVREGEPDLRFVQFHDPELYVAMVHGQNTGNSLQYVEDTEANDHPVWHRAQHDLRDVMGDVDGDLFGLPPRKATP